MCFSLKAKFAKYPILDWQEIFMRTTRISKEAKEEVSKLFFYLLILTQKSNLVSSSCKVDGTRISIRSHLHHQIWRMEFWYLSVGACNPRGYSISWNCCSESLPFIENRLSHGKTWELFSWTVSKYTTQK